jgi:hypothetical protein
MIYCIDIDGTIATENTLKRIEKCNRYFQIGLEPEHLPTDWYAFLDLPEVRAYRERTGEEKWRYNLKLVNLDPGYQSSLIPIEGAVEGVSLLAEQGICYATLRKVATSEEYMREAIQEWNEKMRKATATWLEKNKFPDGPILFGNTPEEKLSQVAALAEEKGEPSILIDDLYDNLLVVLPYLSEHTREVLRDHCTLVAFRAEKAPASPHITTIGLPDWHHVNRLFVAASA